MLDLISSLICGINKFLATLFQRIFGGLGQAAGFVLFLISRPAHQFANIIVAVADFVFERMVVLILIPVHRFGSIIVAPMRATFDHLKDVLEFVHWNIVFVATAFIRLLLIPLQVLFAIIHFVAFLAIIKISEIVEASPLLTAIRNKLDATTSFAVLYVGYVFDLISRSWICQMPIAAYASIVRRLRPLFEFYAMWKWTRSRRYLVTCIPLGLFVAILGAPLVALPLTDEFAREHRYRTAAIMAIRDGNDRDASLYLRKLNKIGALTPSDRYHQASMMSDIWLAYCTMAEIAPRHSIGYGPAHQWIALKMTLGELQFPERYRKEALEHHIRAARKQLPDNISLLQLQAQIDFFDGNLEGVATALSQVNVHDLTPSNCIRLAVNLRQLDQHANAKRAVRFAIAGFNETQNLDSLTEDDVLLWAAALADIGEYSECLVVLRKAVNRFGVTESVDSTCVNILKGYGAHGVDRNWLEYARSTMQLLSYSGPNLNRMVANHCNRFFTPRTLRRVFQQEIAANTLPVEMDLQLADLEAKAGNQRMAREYYERIFRKIETPRIANNLAWLYGFVEPVDLRRAYHYAHRAVQLDSRTPEIRETRGQVLFKMGRWSESVSDLKSALNGVSNACDIHSMLATCYSNLGQQDLARLHRNAAHDSGKSR